MDVAIVEMGVEEKMAPEDQHGGYSHPTSHNTSSDLTASLHTSWTDSMAILTGVGPREQVLLSTSLPTTLTSTIRGVPYASRHFRGGMLAFQNQHRGFPVLNVLWPGLALQIGTLPPVPRPI